MRLFQTTLTALGTAALLSLSVAGAHAASLAANKKSDAQEPVKVAAAEPAKEADAAAGAGGPFKTKDGALVVSEGVVQEDGKWVTPDGVPSYKIKDGQTDWYTFSGYRRYHAECHVCHGPDGLGSTYAPNLVDSMKEMTHSKFQEVIASGQRNVWGRNNSIMPALGDNQNVWCFVDDIYVYLKARADGVVPRAQRPKRWEDKPQEARDYESDCFG